MRVAVVNPGSSSLKATLLEPPGREPRAEDQRSWGVDATAIADPGAAAVEVLERLEAAAGRGIEAVGYRVVHGGTRFTAPVPIDEAVVDGIRDVSDLAPLHNRVAVAVIEAVRAARPEIDHVACFDTGFHAALPAEATRYPLPASWTDGLGIRRYGFHGLSVQWSVRRAAELLDRPVDALRLVVAHLGSGASVTAVDGGRSVDTSMGLTPLEGLMMGTRAGSIDPGILLRLLDRGMPAAEIADVLDHGSGLLGVSGRTSDMRELLALEAAGEPAATLALAVFVRRAAQGIAAAATALPALDGLVFTGGIGEHAGSIRSRIVERLRPLGFGTLPPTDGSADAVLISRRGPAVLRIAAREDLVIATAVAALLQR